MSWVYERLQGFVFLLFSLKGGGAGSLWPLAFSSLCTISIQDLAFKEITSSRHYSGLFVLQEWTEHTEIPAFVDLIFNPVFNLRKSCYPWPSRWQVLFERGFQPKTWVISDNIFTRVIKQCLKYIVDKIFRGISPCKTDIIEVPLKWEWGVLELRVLMAHFSNDFWGAPKSL